ncbi:MAG: low-specificity L-threonine aldolase [Thermodesulfobacteriota bacterium]
MKNNEYIDLRSDTVTQPTDAMRKAMANAQVGDDVYGDDPTVNQLESIAAELLGKGDAIMATSGTQSNLMAVLSHCERGEEYIVGQLAHTYRFEAGGAAVLGSIQPQPLDFEPDGTIDLAKVAQAIKPDDFHFARTKLFCLENTQGGKVLPLKYLEAAEATARKFGLGFHLDGARLFNAAVKLNVPPTAISGHFDTISICLSKGLGAPVGSVLCGSKELIKNARRWRKMLGGGMRQAGILAAAGIIALEDHVDRLQEDHANASFLAEKLAGIDELKIDRTLVQTNMVFAGLRQGDPTALKAYLYEKGVLINSGDPIRMVTHMDVGQEDIEAAVEKIKDYFKSR